MARFATGDARLVLSELVLRELDAAPPAARDIVTAIPTAHVEIVRLSPEAETLARQYLADGIQSEDGKSWNHGSNLSDVRPTEGARQVGGWYHERVHGNFWK